MTTASSPAAGDEAFTLPGRHRELGPPGSRGGLSIHPRVVEKIAATAASEVGNVGGAVRRVLTVSLRSDTAAAQPQVDARVYGTAVTLQVRCSVTYPAPVGTVTEQLRSHLVDRVDALTGLQTRQVDIIVTALTTTRPSSRLELE